MPRKSEKITKEIELEAASIVDESLDESIMGQLKEYGTYVLQERAIPDYHDGLKPSQRRILWTLYRNFYALPTKNHLKCSRVAGGVMQFHAHGDSYPTMVNMIEGTPCPTLDGYGNFGSYSKYAVAGASRYTEVRLSHFSMAMFFDKRFEKAYPTVPNFDGSAPEPVYLPTQLPLILALGPMGIAMATTTNIPSFTVQSLYLAVMASLKNRKSGYKLTPKRLSSILEFSSPYGGKMISKEAEVVELMKTGVASLEWECEYRVAEADKQLFIHGIPPGFNFDNKLDKIRQLPMVSECADISEGENMIVRISFKRMSEDDLEKEMNKVIKHFQSKMHYRINITRRYLEKDELVDVAGAKFTAISVVDLLADWVKHRVVMEKRALKVEHGELREKLRHNKLLLLACNKLDVIFNILKKRVKDKVKVLAKALDITEEDAKTIWSITVGKLDRLSSDQLEEEIKKLIRRAKRVKWLYKNPEKSVSIHMKEVRDTITNPNK